MANIFKYKLNNVGLGDLTFFCGDMLGKLTKGDKLMINIDDLLLTNYRNNNPKSTEFIMEYIKFLLDGFDVLLVNTVELDKSFINWELNNNIFKEMRLNPEVSKVIKEKFSSGESNPIYKNSIIFFTKVRDYNFENFKTYSSKIWDKLNNSNYNIILLGEREIIYNYEYTILTNKKVYTIYDELIKNLNPDKIIDLTVENFNLEELSVKNIINDLTLVSNNKHVIVVGGGGFFCTTLFTDKLLSINDSDIYNKFSNEHNKHVFNNIDDLLNKII